MRIPPFLTLLLSLTFLSTSPIFAEAEVLEVAVLGLGGRVQGLLLECLKLKEETQREIRVVAVCDNEGLSSLDFLLNRLTIEESPVKEDYKNIFSNVALYDDTEDGLAKLFNAHPDLDRVLVTSSNDRHYTHLISTLEQSRCKNIFIEKPLFKSLDEFTNFPIDTSQATIHVGLTLRYSKMTKIAEEKLKEHKNALGSLLKVSSWEHLCFGHSWSIIMMNWRRYQSRSGGFLIEKSVHDLDLALYYMQAVDVCPKTLSITTTASHEFYKKSNKNQILSMLLNDAEMQRKLKKWDTIAWQRIIPFAYEASGEIDWHKTVDDFFDEFPDNDDFKNSDIIPDRHKLIAKIETTDGKSIDFELNVTMNDFTYRSQRGTHFIFQSGNVLIDIEKGKMYLETDSGIHCEYDLNVNNQVHAGGDVYVAHAILGTLPVDQPHAVFLDPVVQLSTVMGLVSEKQALLDQTSAITLRYLDGQWKIEEQ